MPHGSNQLPSSKALLRATVLLAAMFVIGQAVFLSLDLWENFSQQGNDDILRLMVVRDFIDGQGWHDVVQYRILPPDGMPLHWSRYIDAGIAAIIVPLSYFFPMPIAELLGATIWPTLIQCFAVAIVGYCTQRLFGTVAGCFAVICLVLWPVTGGWNSAAGNLDHHNVQMLMMTIIAFCAIWPDRPIVSGAIGGLAAAFSLAVGLETLPFVLGVGIILFARMFLSPTKQTTTALLAFCIALWIGSLAFWFGQTGPDKRLDPMCDQLSTPVLALVWIAALASVLPLFIFRSQASSTQRLVTTTLLTLIGLALAWPLLSHCLAGPYGNLPQDLQDFIAEGVGEALPGLQYFLQYPKGAMLFLPAVTLAPVLLGFVLIRNWKNAEMTPDTRTALMGLWFLSLIGFCMMLVQMRATMLSAAIIPVIVGYIASLLLSRYQRTRDSLAALGGLFMVLIFISPASLASVLHPVLPQPRAPLSGGAECRSVDALNALNEVPPSLLIVDFNLGPSILWLTHHDTLSGGFHTSATAFANGVIPFRLDGEQLREYLVTSSATHFLICANTPYPSAFVTGLSSGAETAPWLRQVSLSDKHPVLFEIVRE